MSPVVTEARGNWRRAGLVYFAAAAILLISWPAVLDVRRAANAEQRSPAQLQGLTAPHLPPLVLPLAALGLLLFVALSYMSGSGLTRAVLLAACVVITTMVVAVYFREVVERHPVPAILGSFLIGLPSVLAALPANRQVREFVFRRVMLLFLGLFAIGLRWRKLFQVVGVQPLPPDAQTHFLVARSLTNPFGTGTREPLPIWVFRIFLWLFGNSAESLRLTGIFFSLCAIAAAFSLARRLFGWKLAYLAALLLAWCPMSRDYSVRGLRDEAIAACVWFFLASLWELSRRTDRARGTSVELPLATALVALCVLASLVPASILLVGAWIRSFVPRRTVVVAVAIGLVSIAPFLWSNSRDHGDAFWSVNVYARGFCNMEFAGEPGFPTKTEVQKNVFMGPHMTTFHYVFGLHSLTEVVVRTLRGYFRIVTGVYQGVFGVSHRTPLLFLAYLTGMCLLVLLPAGRFLVGATLLWLGPIAFLGGSTKFLIDSRLVSPVWALQAVAMAIAVLAVGDRRWRRPLLRVQPGTSRLPLLRNAGSGGVGPHPFFSVTSCSRGLTNRPGNSSGSGAGRRGWSPIGLTPITRARRPPARARCVGRPHVLPFGHRWVARVHRLGE